MKCEGKIIYFIFTREKSGGAYDSKSKIRVHSGFNTALCSHERGIGNNTYC